MYLSQDIKPNENDIENNDIIKQDEMFSGGFNA
jgi:hypothetical protein